MHLLEQHWENLFGNLTTEGSSRYGIWTVFSPQKEIIQTKKGIRNLRANADKTLITHTNQFPSSDGSLQEKQWQIEKDKCNLDNGLLHPADPTKRALSIEKYGSTSWFPQKFVVGNKFSVELFLKHEKWNTSIGSIYDENGSLAKILYLQESINSYPDIPNAKEICDLSGKWKVIKKFMSPDLNISTAEETSLLEFNPNQGQNQTLLLPEMVIVDIPIELKSGKEFEITAGKLVTENQYKRLTIKYDSSGRFTRLISEVFHREL
ncbi:hypothetical protein NIES267_06310 [Calothrix parasitica NIES-267]|uniref:Uncharacterized protein n=1 Tax=Calothrix parasitica NIES-267 TaxID=1973488 RepID=A0A1Z4LIV1_9CYAN|nr:hypothetical protein NIES267_06310 [Calothrix parasitica NIES-267]